MEKTDFMWPEDSIEQCYEILGGRKIADAITMAAGLAHAGVDASKFREKGGYAGMNDRD